LTENKKTVEKYMDGFNKSDHKQILSSVTEDVEWITRSFWGNLY